jgi:DnaJ-class molecular chaperone
MLEMAQDRLLLEPRWRDPEATPYEILGVEPGATAEVIRRAYLDLALYCHPDRYPDMPHLRTQAGFVMKRVNVAYRELSRRPRTRYSAVAAEPPRSDTWEPGFLSTGAGKVALAVMVVVSSILVAVLLASALVFLLE